MERPPDQKNTLEQIRQTSADERPCFDGDAGLPGTREGSSSVARPRFAIAHRFDLDLPLELMRPQFVYGHNQTSDAESSPQPVFGTKGSQQLEKTEDLDGEKGDAFLDKPGEETDYVPAEMHASLGKFVDRIEDASGELREVLTDLRKELQDQEIGQLKEAITEEVQKAVNEVKEQLEESREVLPKLIREEVKNLVAHEIQKTLNELRSPIITEIQEVGRSVKSLQQAVKATYQEVCLANLIANITLEQFRTDSGLHLPLNDRIGQEALTLADDFVKDEPIFILDRNYSHRIRVGLAHKHRSNAKNFRIKYISVKPADGRELGLQVTETLHPSEGSEVVSLFPWDLLESAGLLSSCSQVGMVEDKYVDVAIVIGVEVTADKTSSKTKHIIEMKGRILCLPVSGSKHMTFRRFMRFSSKKWKQAPQWMREAARGAVIMTNVTARSVGLVEPNAHQRIFWWHLFGCFTQFFMMPCFRRKQT